MTSTDTRTVPRPVNPVAIVADILNDIVRRLDTVDQIEPSVLAALHHARDLAVGLEPYLAACTTPESPALRRLAERTRAADWSRPDDEGQPYLEQEMLSGHVEGQTLKFLVYATRAVRVLDIGMFTGYSALAMAEALPTDGVVVACEVDEEVAALARRCFADSSSGPKIDVRIAPALTTLAVLAASEARFDLVFLDADKPNYTAYLNALLESNLLEPHGLICVDNTLMQGEPYLTDRSSANGAAIADFNLALARDPRVEQVVLPLRDGLTLVRRTSTESDPTRR